MIFYILFKLSSSHVISRFSNSIRLIQVKRNKKYWIC